MKNSSNRNNTASKKDRLRQTILAEASRLIYEDGVKQYHTAKWRAAKNILGRGGKKPGKIRAQELPSNGEISAAVFRLAQLHEGDELDHQLFAMRLSALEFMQKLENFSPRLIGSVSTGRIRRDSDIDLHLFTDSIEILEAQLKNLHWIFDKQQHLIQYNGKLREFTHIYIEQDFTVELSIYPESELKVQSRSSTDGKVIKRINHSGLLELLTQKHWHAWRNHELNQC